MNGSTASAAFLHRFSRARREIRRVQVGVGIAWTAFAALLGFALLVAADYTFELPWGVRAAVLCVLICLAAAVGVRTVVTTFRWWSQPRTAREVEQRFPQLGQRIRTVVQFSGRPAAAVVVEGVAPSLVTALEKETDAKTRPLDLHVVVPWSGLAIAALSAVVPLVLLTVAGLSGPEWRVALQRATLANTPYTRLAVTPGNIVVDQGQDVLLLLDITGRLRGRIVVQSRPVAAEDGSWERNELTAEPAAGDGKTAGQYEARLEQVQDAIEYRVVAGSVVSDVYRVDVRYPLTLKEFHVLLTPPAYTGMRPVTVPGGDFEAIGGSNAQFQVTLDGPCSEALLLVRPADNSTSKRPPETIHMQRDGSTWVGRLPLHRDLLYSVAASSVDGRRLPKKTYRIRVRNDQTPQVRFDQPEEVLEVHSLAEVLMRVRVQDDYGLTKAGIVFQVNDGQERTLLLRQWDPVETHGHRDQSKRLRQVALERLLVLEQFSLTPTESVTYYAFAEDNYPDGPHRSETDLRFIDIRPFKRIYQVGGT